MEYVFLQNFKKIGESHDMHFTNVHGLGYDYFYRYPLTETQAAGFTDTEKGLIE